MCNGADGGSFTSSKHSFFVSLIGFNASKKPMIRSVDCELHEDSSRNRNVCRNEIEIN